MFGTSIATTTVTGMLDTLGASAVNATIYTVVTFFGWIILAAVIGYLIYLGKGLLHLR